MTYRSGPPAQSRWSTPPWPPTWACTGRSRDHGAGRGRDIRLRPQLFLDPETGRNPQAFYQGARAAGAVVPGAFGGFEVMRRSEVEYALQHPEIFSSAMEAVDLGQSVPLIPLQVDPPEHSKYRKLLGPDFAPKRMNLIEPDIAQPGERAHRRLHRRRLVRVHHGAGRAPASSVFLRLLGMPLSDLPLFMEMKNGILRPGGRRPRGDPGQSAGHGRRNRALLRRDARRAAQEAPR